MPDNTYKTDGTIDTFANRSPGRDFEIEFTAGEFTSVCPMTGLPDFGTIIVRYVPGERCIELRSFKFYLAAYRNEGVFYEDLVNRILDDIVAAIAPKQLTVIGEMNVRGGISARITATYLAAS